MFPSLPSTCVRSTPNHYADSRFFRITYHKAVILQRGRFIIFKHGKFPLLTLLGLTWKGKIPIDFNVALKWKIIRALTLLAEKIISPTTTAKMLTPCSVELPAHRHGVGRRGGGGYSRYPWLGRWGPAFKPWPCLRQKLSDFWYPV